MKPKFQEWPTNTDKVDPVKFRKCKKCDKGEYRTEVFVPEHNREVCFVHVTLCRDCGQFDSIRTLDVSSKLVNSFTRDELM